MHNDKYIRVRQVVERTGLSRPTIYNMIKAGSFPTQTSLGERAVAWLESEIIKWMDDRKAFEKTGREARPGRPPVKKIKAPSSAEKQILTPVPPPTVAMAASPPPPETDEWSDNPTPITADELAAMRQKLRQSNKPNKNSTTPIARRRGAVENLGPSRKK